MWRWRICEQRRLFFVSLTTALALLVTLGVSFSFYWMPRVYPLASLIPLPLSIVTPLNNFFFLALIAGLIVLLFIRRSALWLSCVGLLGLLFLIDQSRVQVYHCIFLAAGVALALRDLHVLRMIAALMYIWAGIHKFNFTYVHTIFPWVFQPALQILPFSPDSPLFTGIALSSAFVELAVGLGLLIPRLQFFAGFVAIAMHAAILLFVGPLGLNTAPVVWPWNAAMIVYNLVLFISPNDFSWRTIIRHRPALGVFVLFGALPLLNPFGFWDSYLSFHAFSGATEDAYIRLAPEDLSKVPAEFHRHLIKDKLYFYPWSVNEYGISAYPQARTYRALFLQLCQTYQLESTLVVRSVPDRYNGQLTCTEVPCTLATEKVIENCVY